MSNKKLPHETWAKFYDFVYESHFGIHYNQFTTNTLQEIDKFASGNQTILDLGAGTGRLSIPLAQKGFDVIAVEPSSSMTQEIQRKIVEKGVEIEMHISDIASYSGRKVDAAICVFTVLNYITTEDAFEKSIRNIKEHLNTGGKFFFELGDAVFNYPKQGTQKPEFSRQIQLIPTNENGLYRYSEKTNFKFDNETFEYEDDFDLRRWSIEFVDKLLKKEGFVCIKDNYPQFSSTGAHYFLYQLNN